MKKMLNLIAVLLPALAQAHGAKPPQEEALDPTLLVGSYDLVECTERSAGADNLLISFDSANITLSLIVKRPVVDGVVVVFAHLNEGKKKTVVDGEWQTTETTSDARLLESAIEMSVRRKTREDIWPIPHSDSWTNRLSLLPNGNLLLEKESKSDPYSCTYAPKQ